MAELKQGAAAAYLDFSRTTFRRAVSAGLIRPSLIYPFGGVRYDTADLDAYRESARVAARSFAAAVENIRAKGAPTITPEMAEQARQRAQERVAARWGKSWPAESWCSRLRA